jgi:hypothetical protein
MNTKGIREHATLASNVSANGEDGEAEAEAHAASKISWAQLEQVQLGYAVQPRRGLGARA